MPEFTVADLIAKLAELPPDAPVMVDGCHSNVDWMRSVELIDVTEQDDDIPCGGYVYFDPDDSYDVRTRGDRVRTRVVHIA